MAADFDQDAGALEIGGQPVPTNIGPVVKWSGVVLGLVLLFLLLSFVRSVYTDWLWFDSLGFKSVFVKVLTTRIVMFVVGAVAFAALIAPSLYFANRLSRGPSTLPLHPTAEELFRKLISWGSVATGVGLSFIFGTVFASRWQDFLRFANSVPFGQTEPAFNKDVAFYVFTMPMLNFVHGWLLGAAITILIATLVLYYINFSLRGTGLKITSGLKVHLSIIVAILMFVLAWGHWLDRWELALSGQGAVFGAAYTDIAARKPALLILTIIASGSGVLILVNAYLRGLRLLIGAVALWIVMAVVLGGLWPATMQQYTVNPNEFIKEAPYIERNIAFTRSGFALDRIEEAFYPAEPARVTERLIEEHSQTISNIRLWDSRPLSDVYKQIQLIRPYYDFKDADVDRYTLGGEYRQVLLSAREVAPEKLAAESRTWVNEKLIYTHGIGLAMSPVTDFTPEGRPEFFAKDIPANGVIPISASEGEPEILVENPRIYYGENTTNYVVANTNTDELDYQTEEGELLRTNYFGTGGVRLSSFIRRLAYAWQFGDLNILISGEITGDSLLLYHRAVQERISVVAPFLLLDNDPYIVAADGQLYWIQDAYTTSDHYPYSQPYNTEPVEREASVAFNYIRNSVKVTVDSFHGALRFYLWDSSDPVVMTYAKIFPDLFLPKSEMSPSLREHVRYPQDFFTVQARKYIKYHMRDPQSFYNNEDLWAFSNEKFGQSADLKEVGPYYVIMKLPGEETEEFVQLLPYTPNERQNLIGWLAARSDHDNYGKLLAFNFPKNRHVDGTEQVEARIDADQEISAWFTLRCTQGSTCIRGNLLVIPLGNSIIYAEPVYIQSEGVTFPELKRVILATGQKVVMEDSLSEALASLIDTSLLPDVSPTDGVAPPTGSVEAELETLSQVIEALRQDLSRLEEALERLRQVEEPAGGE